LPTHHKLNFYKDWTRVLESRGIYGSAEEVFDLYLKECVGVFYGQILQMGS